MQQKCVYEVKRTAFLILDLTLVRTKGAGEALKATLQQCKQTHLDKTADYNFHKMAINDKMNKIIK